MNNNELFVSFIITYSHCEYNQLPECVANLGVFKSLVEQVPSR